MSFQKRQKTVAIIPARGGSKKIPRKNTLMLGDKPLIAWPIVLAKSIQSIDKIVVSTDDEELAEIAQAYGAEVPFIRPHELSTDEVPTLPVLQHALKYLQVKNNYFATNIVLLYPTAPFLNRQVVIDSIDLLENENYNSVVGVRKVRGVLWKKSERGNTYEQFYPKERVNRQYFTHLYEEAGNLFVNKTSVLLEENKIVSEKNCFLMEIDEKDAIDIDTPEDLLLARKKVEERYHE